MSEGPFFFPALSQYRELEAEHLQFAGARLFCCPNLGANQ